MKTDLEKSQEKGWERSSSYVRQQGAEEVVTRKADNDAAKRRTAEKNRAVKARRDRDRNVLIVGIVAVVLVIILIFSGGKSWQRRIDKKEIELLSQTNAELQTSVQDLKKENQELQDTISAIQETTQQNTTDGTTGTTTSKTHVLQTGYNFREEANVDSDVLAELEEGTSVEIVKELSDGWVQAVYNNQTGYLKCGDELTSDTSDTADDTEGTEDSQDEDSEEE